MFNRVAVLGFAAIVVTGILASPRVAAAQERARASVKIEPYTGPPIFLDEAEQVAEPTIINQDTLTEKYKDGKARIERQIATFSDNHFEADGAYREYYPNGQLFVAGTYSRGRQNGEWTFYYENGQLNRKAAFKDGKPDGMREVYRADGTLSAKRGFSEGLRDGEWITYDATGEKPIAEERYDKGKPDGIWKYWHPNGQLRQQLAIKQGVRHGLYTEWDDKGTKVFEATFAEGKLHGTATRWFPNGRKTVQQYEDGKLVSQSS